MDGRELFSRDSAVSERITELERRMASVLSEGQKLMDDLKTTSADVSISSSSSDAMKIAIQEEFGRVELLVENVNDLQRTTASNQACLVHLLATQSTAVIEKTDEGKAAACQAIAHMEGKVRQFVDGSISQMHATLASMNVSGKGGCPIVYLNNAKDTGLALGKIPDNCS